MYFVLFFICSLFLPYHQKILTSSQYNLKKDPYHFIVPWLAEGLLVSNGSKWQHRRKMLTKAFHFNILKKYTEMFKDGAEEYKKRAQKEVVKEKTDVLAFICPISLHIMLETTMGIDLKEDTPEMITYFKSVFEIGELFTLRMSKFWLHNDFLFSLTNIARLQKRVLADLHEFTTNVINNRRKMLDKANVQLFDDNSESYEKSGKLAMLDLLLHNEKSGLINSEGIREEVDTFMFEGFDTTTVTQTYFIMAIANEPKVQDKIYEEMQNIFGNSNRMPTMEDLNEMKYLECCIKETMRLYPAAHIIARHLAKDTVLSGYTVPANTDCYITIFDLHRRADLYPDPERFDPDRFLPENSLHRNPYAYIPFSAGLRNCIGQKFAMLQMKTTMSTLIRRFRLEPITRPCDLIFKFDIVLRTKNSIYVRFRLRE